MLLGTYVRGALYYLLGHPLDDGGFWGNWQYRARQYTVRIVIFHNEKRHVWVADLPCADGRSKCFSRLVNLADLPSLLGGWIWFEHLLDENDCELSS